MKAETRINDQAVPNRTSNFTVRPTTAKWLAVSLVYSAYFYSFIFLVESLGPQTTTFVTAPVLLGAWLFGGAGGGL